jgi:hypothetical protein
MAEIELRACSVGGVYQGRVPDLETLKAEVEARQDRRNAMSGKVGWRFISTEDTRAKLKRLYPSLQE